MTPQMIVAKVQRLEAEIARLRRVMAAALERTQVEDSGEATFILEREVRLDGTARHKPEEVSS